MTDWPDKPLIRIIRGTISWKPIANEIARKTEKGNFAVANRLCVTGIDGDSIDAWEEVTAVPTATLKRLQQAFRGVDKNTYLAELTQELFSYLPADKPNPLDRAVTRVKDVADTPMVDAETLPADRLSLLLDALTSVQSATRKTALLTMVTRICVDWVQADNPEKIALEQMQSRALSIPEVVGSDPARFIVLAGYIGDAANMLSEAHLDISGQLTNAGTYALAWAAQIIEEEDK